MYMYISVSLMTYLELDRGKLLEAEQMHQGGWMERKKLLRRLSKL